MNRMAGILILAACAAMPAWAVANDPAAESVVRSTFSIGDFAVRMASKLQLSPPERGAAFSAESASWALWRNGVRLRAGLREPLTEADLTSALQQLGFNLVPTDPSRIVDSAKADLVLSTFLNASTLERLKRPGSSTEESNGDDDFNNGNGKGGKFKRKGPKSPSGTF